MKRIVTALVLLFQLFFFYGCQNGVTSNNAELKFLVTELNVGKLGKDEKATYSFKFTNTGNNPLIIQNVKTSCGCTVPQWTKKPIKPGRTGEIEISYAATYRGMFSKTITVFYNGVNSPVELRIYGQVEYSEDLKSNVK